MRELKFRAWDPEEKKMYDIQSIDFARQQFWVKHDLCSYSFGVVPILQYTGLKDINGKEIYESDLVQAIDGTIDLVEWVQDIDTDRNWQHCTGFLIDLLPTSIHCKDSRLNVEVIGNLYETPELAPKSEVEQ
jgi:hypothetical protein